MTLFQMFVAQGLISFFLGALAWAPFAARGGYRQGFKDGARQFQRALRAMATAAGTMNGHDTPQEAHSQGPPPGPQEQGRTEAGTCFESVPTRARYFKDAPDEAERSA